MSSYVYGSPKQLTIDTHSVSKTSDGGPMSWLPFVYSNHFGFGRTYTAAAQRDSEAAKAMKLLFHIKKLVERSESRAIAMVASSEILQRQYIQERVALSHIRSWQV